jgi:RNA polymerase sigma-70 factor (ECF subfamily)
LSLTELPDEELISLSKQGDETAFGEFVRRHAATVHRWMARAVGEQEADDMAQEVFLKAYRGLARFRQEAPPRAWLASIADNAVKNRYRARGRFRRIFASVGEESPLLDPAETARGPEENARAGQSRRYVAEALKLLPAEFRMPVVLRDLRNELRGDLGVAGIARRDRQVENLAGARQLKVLLRPLVDSERSEDENDNLYPARSADSRVFTTAS